MKTPLNFFNVVFNVGLAQIIYWFIRKQSEKPLPSGRGYSYIEL